VAGDATPILTSAPSQQGTGARRPAPSTRRRRWQCGPWLAALTCQRGTGANREGPDDGEQRTGRTFDSPLRGVRDTAQRSPSQRCAASRALGRLWDG